MQKRCTSAMPSGQGGRSVGPALGTAEGIAEAEADAVGVAVTPASALAASSAVGTGTAGALVLVAEAAAAVADRPEQAEQAGGEEQGREEETHPRTAILVGNAPAVEDPFRPGMVSAPSHAMTPDFPSRHAAALALVTRLHHGPKRAGDVPTFSSTTSARVARRVPRGLALAATGEGVAEEREEAMVIAALGHDALEDTPVTAAELRPVFGDRGVALVQGMTNPIGDHDHGPYILQVAAAEEAVRVIKLSDLYDNCTGVAHCLFELGVPWAESFFLPVTRPMIAALEKTTFALYPRTAALLLGMVRTSLALLEDEVARYRAASA